MGLGQWLFFRRNIGQVTPKITYFHSLERFFLNQRIQETFNLLLKTEALVFAGYQTHSEYSHALQSSDSNFAIRCPIIHWKNASKAPCACAHCGIQSVHDAVLHPSFVTLILILQDTSFALETNNVWGCNTDVLAKFYAPGAHQSELSCFGS